MPKKQTAQLEQNICIGPLIQTYRIHLQHSSIIPPAAGQHIPVNPVSTHLGYAEQDPELDDDEASLVFSVSTGTCAAGAAGMCFVDDLITSLVVSTSPLPLPW